MITRQDIEDMGFEYDIAKAKLIDLRVPDKMIKRLDINNDMKEQ